VVEVNDEAWRAAAEGLLRAARWVVVLGRAGDESQAMALAERERYRHYLVPAADAQSVHSGSVPAASMLAVLRVSAPLPGWLTQQLAKVKRVSGTEEGQRLGGEWITPQAYQRDGRGGRSVFVEPSQHQFGAGAVQGRRAAIEARLARAQQVLTGIAQAQHENDRHLADAQRAAQGHQAAEELAQRQGDFAQARSTLPTLQQARAQAGARPTTHGSCGRQRPC